MNRNTCIMHNEQRLKGGKKRETRRRHLVITKGERWKDGQRLLYKS